MLYTHVTDSEIAEIPLSIKAQTVADYFHVSVERVNEVRAKHRRRKHNGIKGELKSDELAFRMMCEKGSRKLLRRMLETGQHFITDPAEYARRAREARCVV